MPRIGVVASFGDQAKPYLSALEPWGAESVLLLPDPSSDVESLLRDIDGLLITGGEDIDPDYYGQPKDGQAELKLNEARDRFEFPLLREALKRDLPILGICRGLQSLNVVTGGTLIQDIEGHRVVADAESAGPEYHRIWISPGSKLASVLGSGGQVRVISIHHQGIREAQKSKLLIASAYSLKDSIIEAVESPYHRWVVGVQWHPENQSEVPKQFQRLFYALVLESSELRVK